MTAETLKPFILPTSNSFNIQKHNPNSKKSGRHLWILIGLSAALLTLSAAAVYITVWEASRIDKLEKQVQSLSNELTDMKKKFGLDYMDDLNDFEKEYSKNDKNDIDSDDEDDYLDSYEQSGGDFLPNHFDDLEDGDDDDDDDDENYDDEYSSESSKKSEEFIDDEKKVRVIRAIDVSVYPDSNVDKKSEEKKIDTVKAAKHKRRLQANYNRQSHPYSYNHHKRRPKVKTMVMAKNSRIHSNVHKLAAAHYYMNSTVPGNHPHHAAHLKIAHDGDIYIGAAHPWARRFDANSNFDIEHGLLKIKENGVYFIYAQVLYENNFDKNGYRIYHNDYPFLQCALTIPTNMAKSNTCYTSGIIYLQSGDMLHMRDLFKDRTVALKSAKSFFGIVKLESD